MKNIVKNLTLEADINILKQVPNYNSRIYVTTTVSHSAFQFMQAASYLLRVLLAGTIANKL